MVLNDIERIIRCSRAHTCLLRLGVFSRIVVTFHGAYRYIGSAEVIHVTLLTSANHMDTPADFRPPPPHHSHIHPIECLRIVEVPRCAFCGARCIYYCGGCYAAPAFCSADHFMKASIRPCSVGLVTYLIFVRHHQYWPIHSQTCNRDIRSASRLSGRPPTHTQYPYSDVGVFTTRIAVDPLPPVSIDHMPAMSASGDTYDYIVDGLYANHMAGTWRPHFLFSAAYVACDVLTQVSLRRF